MVEVKKIINMLSLNHEVDIESIGCRNIQMKCNGVLGRMLGHSFRPIITKDASTPHGSMSNVEYNFFDAFHKQHYHGIYCKRCGASFKYKE